MSIILLIVSFSKNDCSVVITTKTSPDLLKRLHDAFSEPVDSYWNGSHTWFTEWGDIDLEWRLHPVSAFEMPEASRPEELFELALEGQLDVEHYWEGLEVFVINDGVTTPDQLAHHVKETLGIDVDAQGFVNHDVIGNSYEHSAGNTSVISELIEQMNETD